MEMLHTAAEVRELADKDIENRLREARARLREIRFKAVTERTENTAEYGQVRRMIARMMTVLRERRDAAAGAAQKKAS
ncbi:MAG: 50S ribosomal protein L29 [Deltaproteobacteria bacterium]|nr:50S ribosomal protein L29 [Deltaproteobacteria bacterium]